MQKNNADIVQLGYIALLKSSVFFSCHISHAEFLALIDPSNLVGHILLSHLVAVQTLIAPIHPDERADRKTLQIANGMVRWLEVAHANMDPRMRSYFEWPIKRAEEVRDWLQHEKALANQAYLECFGEKSDNFFLISKWYIMMIFMPKADVFS
jgi:hypothetical protein